MANRFPSWLAACLLLVLASCSDKAAPETFASAEDAVATAAQAIEKEQWQNAVESLTTAIDSGGLSPDAYGQALLDRARCNVELKQYEQAESDLEHAGEGAPLDQVHAMRAYLLSKKGDGDGAEAEINKARQINPNVSLLVE